MMAERREGAGEGMSVCRRSGGGLRGIKETTLGLTGGAVSDVWMTPG